MFELGWSEILVIAIVMIVVVGPKDLPRVLRAFGRTTSKMRVMANDFRRQFDEAMREAELDDVKKIVEDVKKLDPTSEIKKHLSPLEKVGQDIRKDLDSATKSMNSPASSEKQEEAKPKAASSADSGQRSKAEEAAKPEPAKPLAAKPIDTKSAAAAKPASARPQARTTKPRAKGASETKTPAKTTAKKTAASSSSNNKKTTGTAS